MLSAAIKALKQVLSPPFRAVLWKSLGLTLVLFVALWAAVLFGLSWLTLTPWPWLDTIIDIIAGIGTLVLLVVLIGPVTAMFAGLFLDDIAGRVERVHYPGDPPGKELAMGPALLTAVQFAVVILLVNLLVLPTFLIGVGVLAMVVANAYLLGREFFEMVAMRHMPMRRAKELRKDNAGRVFAAGFIPAALALLPLANLLLPLFATAYMVHIFKLVAAEDAARAHVE